MAADGKKLSQARNWMANHAAIFFASRVKRNCLHEAFHDDDDDDDDDACHQKGKWLPSPRPLVCAAVLWLQGRRNVKIFGGDQSSYVPAAPITICINYIIQLGH